MSPAVRSEHERHTETELGSKTQVSPKEQHEPHLHHLYMDLWIQHQTPVGASKLDHTQWPNIFS